MNIGYLISSHKDYQAPRERLTASMAAIDVHTIRMVIGGHPEREVWFHTVAHVPHNSYDYTALVDFVEHPGEYPAWSHIFLLHDTMELGPDADRLIRTADPSVKATAVWGGQCNLGLYRADYLLSRRADILALKDCTKQQAVAAEGFLWRQLSEAERASYPGGYDQLVTEQTYGGAERLREYYSGVDIWKYKANWGQHPVPDVVTP